jgi:hypothetical protein
MLRFSSVKSDHPPSTTEVGWSDLTEELTENNQKRRSEKKEKREKTELSGIS